MKMKEKQRQEQKAVPDAPYMEEVQSKDGIKEIRARKLILKDEKIQLTEEKNSYIWLLSAFI